MLLSANDLRQTGKNLFPVISGCKDTLPGSGYLSQRIGEQLIAYPGSKFLEFLKMSISTLKLSKIGFFFDNFVKFSVSEIEKVSSKFQINTILFDHLGSILLVTIRARSFTLKLIP